MEKSYLNIGLRENRVYSIIERASAPAPPGHLLRAIVIECRSLHANVTTHFEIGENIINTDLLINIYNIESREIFCFVP